MVVDATGLGGPVAEALRRRLGSDRVSPFVFTQKSKSDLGYDLLAWALHLSGNDEAASQAMNHALSLGTRDAMLFYHAGLIARALGNEGKAAQYLRQALETNAHWDPLQPARAQEILR